MTAEYNNITLQNQVRSCLQGMKLLLITQKQNCDVTEGFDSIRNLIAKYAPQSPISYRFEEAKVEHLYNSVIGSEWAKTARTQCYANCPPWTFQQRYTVLDQYGYKSSATQRLHQKLWSRNQTSSGKRKECMEFQNEKIFSNLSKNALAAQ